MTSLNKPVLFIATANDVDAREFYEQKLGLECVSDDPYALVFTVGHSTLRIQKVESVPQVRYTVLGWEVADIRASVQKLSGAGVEIEKFSHMPQDELGVWRAPSGASIAWFKDPDGNTLSLTEPAK